MSARGPLLSLEGVAKTHWRGLHELPVLRDVSLEMAPRNFIAVYGAKGSGKTTLLKVAAGIEAPDAGRVRFDGHDLAALSRSQLARLHREELAWVRRSGPLSPEVRMIDYVALPLLSRHGERAARKHAKRVLAQVGAETTANACWGTLSDGERTAVAIAHGIVRAPRLLLVDDPVSGLDPFERERIVGLLRSFAAERSLAVLMVVPDLTATLRARDVRALNDGKLLAPDGPHGRRGVVIDFPGGERSA